MVPDAPVIFDPTPPTAPEAFARAPATSLATVGASVTPTRITIKPPTIFPNILIDKMKDYISPLFRRPWAAIPIAVDAIDKL